MVTDTGELKRKDVRLLAVMSTSIYWPAGTTTVISVGRESAPAGMLIFVAPTLTVPPRTPTKADEAWLVLAGHSSSDGELVLNNADVEDGCSIAVVARCSPQLPVNTPRSTAAVASTARRQPSYI